ncbi:cytotoxic and regulatory T-cell molecule [Neosynchiropus ocellatus]
MEGKLQLCVLLLVIQGSLAGFQRTTLWKGQTVTLKCPGKNAYGSALEWTDPRGTKMFDGHHAPSNPRYAIIKRSDTKFTVTVSNVNFRDGGNYTCSWSDSRLPQKMVEVEVLGKPKMRVTRVGGKTFVHCSAEGSRQPPHISWKFDGGPEFSGTPQLTRRGKKHVSTDVLRVKPNTDRTSELRCFVQHPSLPSRTEMDFVTVVRHHATTTKSDFKTPESSALPPEVSSSLPLSTTHGFPTASLNTTYPRETSTSFLNSTQPVTENNSTGANTTDQTFVSETTNRWNVTGQANDSGSRDHQQKHAVPTKNSPLLIFLVTCLLLALLVTIVFIAFKLRRAHITWKRENDLSNPSEESSKSKSSQEEKNPQNIRQKGPYNTPFTLYRVECPSVPTVTEVTETEEENNAATNTPTSTKETEL